MEILVCVKQVPDTEEIKIDLDAGTLKDGYPTIINPYDKNALEAAVQLKEAVGGKVTVLSLGIDKAKAALKECVSVGADEAVLVNDPLFEGADSLATSKILAAAINKLGQFDLILCGNQAIDTDAGQVGPQLAEHLKVAQATNVAKIEAKDGAVIVNRELDEGIEVVEVKLPAVCTVLDSINEPRLATIKTKMAANKAKIAELTAADLGIEGSLTATNLLKTFALPKREAGVKIKEATGRESAQKLVEELAAAKIV
ncbi:electron transfer flavoprotein subunit beta/FixA family protein [Bacillus sp. B15-48]|uniref:electron transfer flavoprotein subunit beta/FixA family protein n=1 Tax=Bacillus sp. B15-48 TaxID=1548601 RepID=UPI00193F3B56|nr:electron transfer flavoprotein subunit beta/FixA family protein [Bacillus sp. B15-48]MBM4761276.1 electron transfer flavoprotein subunit beta [Bacillus sp. B15-48]